MNAPCEQLQSMKGPQCAWSIRRDVGQGLHMVKMFPCSSYGALLTRGMVLDSAHVFCELLRKEGALVISLQA